MPKISLKLDKDKLRGQGDTDGDLKIEQLTTSWRSKTVTFYRFLKNAQDWDCLDSQ